MLFLMVNTILEKYFKKRRWNVSPVAVKFAVKFLFQHVKDVCVSAVRVARRKAKGNDSTPAVAHKMQFEAIKPIHRALSALQTPCG